MLLIVSIPIGLTLGAATWSLIRGRGGFAGLVLSLVVGVISAIIGGLAGQALMGPGTAQIGLGSLAGSVLAAIVEAVGWGPRPKRGSAPGKIPRYIR
jgi:hypothetical protein